MPDIIIRAAVVPVCGNCTYGKTLAQDLTTVLCIGVPPTPIIVGVDARGGPQITLLRAQMKRTDEACALWRERKEVAV